MNNVARPDFRKPRTRRVRSRYKLGAKWAELYVDERTVRLKVDARLTRAAALTLGAQILSHADLLPGGNGYSYDPEDSRRLEAVLEAIDNYLLWPSEAAKEAGNHVEAVEHTGKLLRQLGAVLAKGGERV